MSLPQALEEALFDSLSTGTFEDVKLYAFSQRTSSGRVRAPKPLYANSHVLRTVPYFHSLLSDTFSEGKLKDLRDPFPSDQPTELEDHGFLDDTDLEDVDDDMELNNKAPETAPKEPRLPSRDPVFGSGSASTFSPDLEPRSENAGIVSPIRSTPSVEPGAHLGKVVVLRDVSFTTLRAVLFFLYTGEIIFTSPSTGANSTSKSPNAKEFGASANSVYLAADKYDIPELKALALNWIRAATDSGDVVQELRSNFTAMFAEIREVRLQQLANALCTGDRVNIAKNLMTAIRSSIHGNPDLGIDPETRGAIFDMLAKGYAQKTAAPYVSPRPNRPPNWQSLRGALQKSLMSGKFLDMEIKTYRGRQDNQLMRPTSIHFSTAGVPPTTMKKIVLESINTNSSPEHEYESDSDLEDDEEERSGQLKPHNAENLGQLQLLVQHVGVVKNGSWKTWHAALFFMYSGKIAFSPIRSQGVPRLQPPELQRMGFCSPKSALVLAGKIGLQSLQDRARQGIVQKVTAENAVTEYFSKFVNSHAPLFQAINSIVQKERNAEIDAMVRKRLVESEGDDPHVSAALELFLQNMIEANDRRIIGHCTICHRGHNPVDQPNDGKCQSCAAPAPAPAPAPATLSKNPFMRGW